MVENDIYKVRDMNGLEDKIKFNKGCEGIFVLSCEDIIGKKVRVVEEVDEEVKRAKIELSMDNWMDRKISQHPDGFLIHKEALNSV